MCQTFGGGQSTRCRHCLLFRQLPMELLEFDPPPGGQNGDFHPVQPSVQISYARENEVGA
jgi:hypothetical protein